MSKYLNKLLNFWLNRVYPSVVSLIAAIGSLGLISCLVILFLVAKLFEEVLERESFAFDKTCLLWIHQFANPTLDQIMLIITKLGNPNFVVIIASVTLGLLWWKHYRKEATIFVIACLGTLILNNELKLFFGKPRPELWPRLITETSYSFPSGHALGSLVLYGFIAYLLGSYYPKLAKVIYSLAVFLIGAIGFSRLYLGVHWPTDVIAGYGVGFLWLNICIIILKLLIGLKPNNE